MPYVQRYTLECYFDRAQNRRMVKVHRGSFEENRDCLDPEMIACKEVTYYHQFCTPRKDQARFAKEHHAGQWYY